MVQWRTGAITEMLAPVMQIHVACKQARLRVRNGGCCSALRSQTLVPGVRAQRADVRDCQAARHQSDHGKSPCGPCG